MAETPSDLSPPPPIIPPIQSDDNLEYWCYSCDKRVSVETLSDLQSDVVCFECKNGFVESLSLPPSDPDPTSSQFLQVLRFIAQASRDQITPTPSPFDPSDDDFLRIELNAWDDENDNNDHDENENENEEVHDQIEQHHPDTEYDDDEDENSVVVIPEGVIDHDDDDEEDDDDDDEEEEEEGYDVDENHLRRSRNDVLRFRLRDFATRAGSQRNRILDWAEILMGLEDHSIEFRLQVPETDTYVGNPGDYVDAAGYEALLQNLAESDVGRRGAPPAAKSAVEKLESVVIGKEDEGMSCAICKEAVSVGEVAKNMPCGHGYHGECIVTWLFSRNSCPVCRFELATDDVEYEEERKKREGVGAGSSGAGTGPGEHSSE